MINQEAMQVARDMSAVLGQDLRASISQVEKALSNPAAGITSLARIGVSFSVEQMGQIKRLTAQNDLANAQRVLLNQLVNEFGCGAVA